MTRKSKDAYKPGWVTVSDVQSQIFQEMFLSRIRKITVTLVDYVIHGSFASGMNLRDIMLEKKLRLILKVEGFYF